MCIRDRFEGQLHSGKLCQALLQLVQSMGVTILNGVDVEGFENVNGRVSLQANLPHRITTSRLLICTNAFAKKLLADIDLEPARGQVLLTSPIAGLSLKGTYHFDEGYYYFRNLGRRVLLGGARNKDFAAEQTTEMQISETIQQELERFLQTNILPAKTYTIEQRWSGIMAIGSEKKPVVRQVDENVFCAVRMSGMGVAISPEVGKRVAALLLGSPERDTA